MTYKMPERIDAAPPKITQGTTMLGNWTVNQSTHIQTEYIRADLLKWKDTRKGELPAPDDFPVLIKDDFESAFNLPAKILVNDGTRAGWHSNYPFWRRILEVDA